MNWFRMNSTKSWFGIGIRTPQNTAAGSVKAPTNLKRPFGGRRGGFKLCTLATRVVSTTSNNSI